MFVRTNSYLALQQKHNEQIANQEVGSMCISLLLKPLVHLRTDTRTLPRFHVVLLIRPNYIYIYIYVTMYDSLFFFQPLVFLFLLLHFIVPFLLFKQ